MIDQKQVETSITSTLPRTQELNREDDQTVIPDDSFRRTATQYLNESGSYVLPLVRKICCFWREFLQKIPKSQDTGQTMESSEQLSILIDRLRNEQITPVLKSISQHRKTLVLDLDQTLVHTKFHPFNSDFSSSISVNGHTSRFHTKNRFGVDTFLRETARLFQIVVFTAGVKDYAKKVVSTIDREGRIKHVLTREDCTPVNKVFIKNLKLLNRPMSNVILLDNSPNSGLLQPQNLLLIKDFVGGKPDRELLVVLDFLKYLNQLDDVRPIERHRQDFIQRMNNKQNSIASLPPIKKQVSVPALQGPNHSVQNRAITSQLR